MDIITLDTYTIHVQQSGYLIVNIIIIIKILIRLIFFNLSN